MNIEKKQELARLHQKGFWFHHQSRLTCKLGSDGVGFDQLHPVDQLQAACRNLNNHLQAFDGMVDDIEASEINIRKTKRKLAHLLESDLDKDVLDDELKLMNIELRKQERELVHRKQILDDRKVAVDAFWEHVVELWKQVENKYKDFDDALPEIWACRVAYQALCKNHPLGQELKVALMTEDQKEKLLDMLDFPKNFPAPNAENIKQGILQNVYKLKGDSCVETILPDIR